MLRLPVFLLWMIAMNVLVAGVLHGWVYDALDTFVYEKKELLFKDALAVSRDHFANAPPEQWNSIGDTLGVIYHTNAMVYTRDSKELPAKVLDYIADPITSRGVVDPFTPDVYYPLGANHVFILGPLYLTGWQQYVIEWVTFISAIFASSLVLLMYYLMFQRHLERIHSNLEQLRITADQPAAGKSPAVTIHDEKLATIYQLLATIKTEQQQLHYSNEIHIQSQRDLLHGVAHEFRSPMARMQFALEMIKSGNDPLQQDQLIDKLNHGIEELDDLVKELLSYSRIKHLNHQLQLESVAVNQLIQDSINKVSSFYPEVKFCFDDHNDSQINVDDKLIQRALANILRNAGRFSKTICQVTVKRTEQDIIINIDDDGVGIPPGKRERIFEPFTRLDPSRSRDSGGTGLGLAIVQSIIEQHQGSVKVDDSELGGACFSLHLPYLSR